MNVLKKIEVYGDSILKGIIFDRSSRKYLVSHAYDTEVFRDELPLEITNRSKFGCTIEKGYRILEKTLDKGAECDVVLLEYGGNDCDFNWTEVSAHPEQAHLPHTEPNTFIRIYREILQKLRERHITPVMMTLPPIDAEKYLDWITRDGLNREHILSWLGDVHMIYRFQEMYSGFVSQIAHDTGTLLLDVRTAFLSRHDFKELLCDDGIHPSEKGQGLIRECIMSFGKSRLAIV